MKKKWVIVVLVILVALGGLGASLYLNQKSENAALERIRSLPVPSNWQLTATEDTLVRGLCLGGGSECGYISREYSTDSTKEKALEDGIAKLENEGWAFDSSQLVRDELQVKAKQDRSLLYLSTSDNKARIRYEENN